MRITLLLFVFCLSITAFAQNQPYVRKAGSNGTDEAYLRERMKEEGLSQPMINKMIKMRENLMKQGRTVNWSPSSKTAPVANTVCDMGGEGGWNVWQWQTGSNSNGNPPTWTGTPASNPAMPDFYLTSGLGIDPNTPDTIGGPKIPVVCPGFGNHSIRIGDTCTNGAICQMLTFSLAVTVNDTDFIYAYAAVLDNAGHAPIESPFVSFGIYDQAANLIPGTGFMDTASAMTNYHKVSGTGCAITGGALYKPWTINSIDLTAYVGQTVTIAIINADCVFSGHFAYSYFDFACGGLNMFTNVTTTPVTCPGMNGSATVNVIGGTPPFTYAWSNVQTTQTITGLAAGTYTVVVTDSTGSTSTNIAVVGSAGFSANVTVTPVACFGGSNGSVVLTPLNGTLPYTYQWSNGQTTKNLVGLTVGTYSVLVTDSTGCSTTATALVTGSPMLISNLNYTPTSCTTCPDGSAFTTVAGGTAPYAYKWSPGNQTTPIITGQLPGSYTVCVTDSKNCKRCDSVAIWTVGINEYIEQAVTILPNPSSGNFVIDFGNKDFGNTEVVFTDLLGRDLFETSIQASGKQPIEVSVVSPGIYFLKLKTEQGTATKKIVIAK